MRLIDADAFEEFVKEKCSYCTSFIGEEDVLTWIDKAPTIDPNELDLDIDYSIEYDKRPDGISNAKVTITRIKPSDTKGGDAKMGNESTPKYLQDSPQDEGDLISRQDAIDTIEYWYGIDVSEAINKMPTADKPKGEWLNDGLESFGIRTAYICSCCGYSTRYYKDFKNTTNYCPCCGARMKGDVE